MTSSKVDEVWARLKAAQAPARPKLPPASDASASAPAPAAPAPAPAPAGGDGQPPEAAPEAASSSVSAPRHGGSPGGEA